MQRKTTKKRKVLIVDDPKLIDAAEMLVRHSGQLLYEANVLLGKGKKLIKQSDAYATEITLDSERKVIRSWNMLVGELGQYGTVVDYSMNGGYKQTPVLRAHGIRACSRCGMLQPQETLYCKACGSL